MQRNIIQKGLKVVYLTGLNLLRNQWSSVSELKEIRKLVTKCKYEYIFCNFSIGLIKRAALSLSQLVKHIFRLQKNE